MTEPLITIAILNDPSITFELLGGHILKGSNEVLEGKFQAAISSSTIEIIKPDGEIIDGREFIFDPIDEKLCALILYNVVIGREFHWERKENQRFLGSLKLCIENNKITAINIIAAEEYLKSVISSEMRSTSNFEFMKAHSVISRSWLISQLEKKISGATTAGLPENIFNDEDESILWYDKKDHKLYDFCADDHCQRYQGISKGYTENAVSAVAETRGIVLRSGGVVCDTRYSKCCGGVTELYGNVWEPVNYDYLQKIFDYKFDPDGYDLELTKEIAASNWIRKKPPAFCNTTDRKILMQVLVNSDQKTRDFYRWKVEYSQDEISSIIRDKTGMDFGDIIDLQPIERGVSGRIIRLNILGSKKSMVFGKELEIRRVLSPSHLYSSAIVFDKKDTQNNIPSQFILHGAGWGHGVGLCQIGAAMMSEIGYYFDEILLHYYNGAVLHKAY